MSDQTFNLADAITKNGYRLTPARRAIIEALVACEGHITADDLAERVRAAAPRVGRMTVYRTLELLCELGAIRPIYQGTGAAHFILMQNGRHHHLICNRCHRVIEFEDCFGEEMAQQLAARFNFDLSGHLLELHGLCEGCRT